ncbi:hypothetical protein QE152_g24480 [Popillia japonica]|uniref:Uncharacterized protein n=1 Tax=Popillia japonica TaxID=7064 RepID=A0AAW1KFR7_POPJA
MQEALELSYESESDTGVTDVFIEPPECHILTDEDSADEDEGGLADNLSARQLRAGAEARFANSKRMGDMQSDLANFFTRRTSNKRTSRGRTMCCKCDLGLFQGHSH